MDDVGAVYKDEYCLANGLAGEALMVRSANPKNFYQAISDTASMPRLDLWAKLFVPDAAVAPNAPTVYIANHGAFILPTSDEPDPALVDLDGFLYAAKADFAVRSAHIAGTPDLAPLFIEDMMTFWADVMTPPPT